MKLKNYLQEKIFTKVQIEKTLSNQVREDLVELYGAYENKEQSIVYARKKIGLSVAVIGVGVFLSVLICFMGQKKSEIMEDSTGMYVEREDIGGNIKQIMAEAEIDSQMENVMLEVNPRAYTQEEFYEICNEISHRVNQTVLGENPSFHQVSKNLNFISTYEAYPIQLSYLLNDYTHIHSDGSLDLTDLEENELVLLTIQFCYQDYLYEEEFPLQLVKDQETESVVDLWKEKFVFLEKNQNTNKKVYLPMQIEGNKVFLREKKDVSWIKIGLIFCFMGILIFLFRDYDLHKNVIERRQQLLNRYPEFVSKLMLYLGAGMSTKNVMYKLCEEYGKKKVPGEAKNYLYEELKIMIHEMDNGVYEYKAYEAFGLRCRVTQYKKLMTLLVENNKKGSKDILALLEKEGKESFELRKTRAKRWGEKAGTKLLLPMMLLFGMVMILIMIPAFLSYNVS